MLEIIASTVEEAVAAEQAGADRIELVSALSEGGLTPSYGLIRQVVSTVEIPVHVLVRPHSKSFVYSKSDEETIITDIDLIRELGAAGIVVGSLTADGRVDEGFLGRIIKHKGELSLTFHRAIDSSRDIFEAAEVLADFPEVDRILTSGGQATALEGKETIARLIADYPDLIILPGSGITLENAEALLEATKASELHVGSAVLQDGAIQKERVEALTRLLG
ncbi:copper homeostasis protein CutC [Exiguobacterium acetylicum]|uniref:copper homeostasis protein CutC n=1 Tax=Exiguobacterium TaxID=33986 RepID=UPI0006FC3B21|nr:MULTISPECIES: copper homeostasis protein CutC [Exiguobacterium]KQS44987.1 copper homeostasis protein [Exiguobacterium sp. Leaf196]MDQ6466313.1 copper homeostasis protein CutC [Exiguobacterium acetylicum]MDT0171814.1 copper homeostasis protein CutC [Exiguobacterium sp. BRG2]